MCDRCGNGNDDSKKMNEVADKVEFNMRFVVDHNLDLHHYSKQVGRVQRSSNLCAECSKKLAAFMNGAKLENESDYINVKVRDVYSNGFQKLY